MAKDTRFPRSFFLFMSLSVGLLFLALFLAYPSVPLNAFGSSQCQTYKCVEYSAIKTVALIFSMMSFAASLFTLCEYFSDRNFERELEEEFGDGGRSTASNRSQRSQLSPAASESDVELSDWTTYDDRVTALPPVHSAQPRTTSIRYYPGVPPPAYKSTDSLPLPATARSTRQNPAFPSVREMLEATRARNAR
ncbi:MAG: hypothetical protein Q9166_006643 [cf. Caloplaca sp. 2 TL-2023]